MTFCVLIDIRTNKDRRLELCSLATAGTQEQTNNNLSLIYFDSSETNKQKLP